MKSNTFLKFGAPLAVAICLAISCTSSDKKNGHTDATTMETDTSKSIQGNPEFSDAKVKAVFDSYIELKEALVASDSVKASNAASKLEAALAGAGSTKGNQVAGQIEKETTLDGQRKQFNQLSADVETLLKSNKLASGTVYKQYCPMAYEGEGAYWLSNESGIRNPYYGDEMLKCGSVEEEIK